MPTSSSVSASYRFERDPQSPSGFLSKNRASTDALSVLQRWQDSGAGRSFHVTVDEDEVLQAMVTFAVDDVSAGDQIDRLCLEYGVIRSHIVTK